MTAQEQITKRLMEVETPADVRAGQVFKGFAYDGVREADGWWFQPFNASPIWLGKNLSDAKETIKNWNE